MTPSRDPNWRNVQNLEDCMAQVQILRDRCQVIRQHAWRQGNWPQVFVEATAAAKELDELGGMMAACWERLYEAAKGHAE